MSHQETPTPRDRMIDEGQRPQEMPSPKMKPMKWRTELKILPTFLGKIAGPLPAGRRSYIRKDAAGVELTTAGSDVGRNSSYGEVVAQLGDIPFDFMLDGVLNVVDDEGRPHSDWLELDYAPLGGVLQFYPLDLLYLKGKRLLNNGYGDRNTKLSTEIMPFVPSNSPNIKLLPTTAARSVHRSKELLRQHLAEGHIGTSFRDVVSGYKPNSRSLDWILVRNPRALDVSEKATDRL